MASDYYRWRGKVGKHHVQVEFLDSEMPDADRITDVRIREGKNSWQRTTGVDNQTYQEIKDSIRANNHQLKYLGGWSPDGSTWGADNIRGGLDNDP